MEGRATPTLDELRADPSCSKWLIRSLESALDRDPVDAANDAELLAAILAEECAIISGGDFVRQPRRPVTR